MLESRLVRGPENNSTDNVELQSDGILPPLNIKLPTDGLLGPHHRNGILRRLTGGNRRFWK